MSIKNSVSVSVLTRRFQFLCCHFHLYDEIFMKLFQVLKLLSRRKMSQAIEENGAPSKIVQKMLNKDKFTKKISCPCLIVKNSKKTSEILPPLKKFLFKALKFKPVIEEGNESVKNFFTQNPL